MQTIITHAEALAIMNDENSVNLPYCRLTENGQVFILKWCSSVFKGTEVTHNALNKAEMAVYNAGKDEYLVIEANGGVTKSGNPETLNIPKNYFEWVVNK